MKKGKFIFVLISAVLMTGCVFGCGSTDSDSGNKSVGGAQTAETSENTQTTELSETFDTKEKQEAADMGTGKRVAKDGADMQTDDKSMPTRNLPENGTKINMHFGDTVIPGVLNDCETAQALIGMLPVTVHMNRYSHDFCGSASKLDLPYREEEVHYGWLNGDIDYAIDAPWFTILFEDEDASEQYGYQVNIGVIDCPLSDISSLSGSFDVLIELAE